MLLTKYGCSSYNIYRHIHTHIIYIIFLKKKRERGKEIANLKRISKVVNEVNKLIPLNFDWVLLTVTAGDNASVTVSVTMTHVSVTQVTQSSTRLNDT